ncbi:MAG TPA: LysR family transcriptional regulator [Oceanospirillaceae bacterium]|nr:LysR family transcriptional regulator [Oceanospirillaceae bacterium]
MLKLSHKGLNYFNTAVQLGTVRAAADQLNVAPSAVSRQISKLEAQLGNQLVERGRRGVKLTEAGCVLQEYVQQTQALEQTCVAALEDLHGLQAGHVDLAVGEGFVNSLVGEALPSLQQAYPQVSYQLHFAGTNEVIRQVELDEVHMGLVFHPPRHPRISSHHVSRQPLQCVMAPDHPLASHANLAVSDMLDYPLALQTDNFGIRQLLAMAEFEQRIQLQPQLVTNAIAALKQFAQSQQGMTVLPEFVVRQEVQMGLLACVPIDHALLQNGEVHLVTRQSRRLLGAPQLMLQHLRWWLAQ